jgi:hypothetical protein
MWLSEASHPDVPETNGAIVPVKRQWTLADFVTVFGQDAMPGFPMNLGVRLHEDAIVKQGDASGAQ